MASTKLRKCVFGGVLAISFVLAIGCVGKAPTPPPVQFSNTNYRGIINVEPREAYYLIQNNRDNPNFVIIDVRLSKWIAYGYIEGAINIPLNTSDTATFESKVDGLDRDDTYLTYCPDGCGAAAQIMNSLGFNKIYDIQRGYKSWVEEGLPVIE